jgi:tRNA(fMet)-specific endonuclease VapC
VSFLLRGGYASLDEKYKHMPKGVLFVSVITQAEVLFGLKPLEWHHQRRTDAARFFRFAQILDWTGDAAEAYADVRYALTVAGRPIGRMDMMIAAHALAANLILVSNNTRHYERLTPPLRLENWTET